MFVSMLRLHVVVASRDMYVIGCASII